jgi:hypothetical protein
VNTEFGAGRPETDDRCGQCVEERRAFADTSGVNTKIRTTVLALAVSIAVVPVAATPAFAASKSKSKSVATKTSKAKKRAAVKPKRTASKAKTVETVAVTSGAPVEAPVETEIPAGTPAPTFTSVTSIGGFVFYNVSYAEAFAAYEALIASGVTPPPPVTSISVTTTVGGN